MYKVLRPTADTYVTNRFVNGTSQTTANVGLAGSLDLFKLYGFTSTLSGTTPLPNTELSRLLLHFDMSPLRSLVAQGAVDFASPAFSCQLHLFDVYGGQPTPDNFTIAIYPLSASFSEGHGRDVVMYSDFDTANWLTSSWASGSWFTTGCGLGGSSNCDYLTTFVARQYFPKGTEDLNVDVTAMVSATLAGTVPDAGFRVSFDVPFETDAHTYFVKRFASRQAYNSELRPQLVVRFDDSVQDDTDNLFLDSTSYLFLYNYVRSNLANLTSGSSAVTGSNSLKLTLVGEFPSITLGQVSSSVVLNPGGPFAFINPSNLLFTGTYSGSHVGGPTASPGALLIGFASGTIPASARFVPSGSFTLADGVTPAFSGTAVFSGTLNGVSDVYALTGTLVPDGGFLFSGTYAVSSTLGPVPYIAGPFNASQLFLGSNPQTGIYSASVLLSSTDPTLQPQWQFSGSVSFIPVWGSNDGTVGYLTGSTIKAYPPQRGPTSLAPRQLTISVVGLHDEHNNAETRVVRIHIFDFTQPVLTNALKLPVELPGIVVRDVHYQVRDANNGLIVVPFDLVTNATRLSNDAAGMFFRLDTSNLTPGHTYVIDILVNTVNNPQLYRGASSPFRVVDVA